MGAPAPSYAAATLEGDTVSLEGLRGSAVLLNVWATWCAPCRHEMPELQALQDRYGGRGLEVVGVSVDRAGAADEIRSFLEEVGVTYTILHDPGERVTDLFSVYGLPATFLIDREGTVVWRRIGPLRADEAELAEVLDEILS